MERPLRIAGLAGVLLALAMASATTPAQVPAVADPAPIESTADDAVPEDTVVSENGGGTADPDGEPSAGTVDDDPVQPRADTGDVSTVWGDRFAVAGDSLVPEGEVRSGDFVSIGGTIRVDGTLRGSVTVIGGKAIVTGEVTRDVVAVFSALELGDGAHVDGSVINVLGSLDDRGASIRHDFVDIPLGLRWPGLEGPLQVLATLWLWSKMVLVVLVFLGILVLAALVPERVDRLAAETERRPWIALVVGIPAFLLGIPAVLLLLTVSVIGLVALPVAVLAIAVLIWLGYAGLFLHVGRRIGHTMGREMSVLGGMLLGFMVFAVLWFVPLLGSIVWTVLTWIATGLVITGRFGATPRGSAPSAERPGDPPAVP